MLGSGAGLGLRLLLGGSGACVAVGLPGGREAPRLVEAPNARRKAVPHGAADPGFRHARPAPVPGRVTGLEAGGQPLGLLRRERPAGRPHGVRVRVVPDQGDPPASGSGSSDTHRSVSARPARVLVPAGRACRSHSSGASATSTSATPLRTHPWSHLSAGPGLAGSALRAWATGRRPGSPGQAGGPGRAERPGHPPMSLTRNSRLDF